MLGAHVVYGRDKGIHVSGHGCQEDQKLMINMTRPKFFLPVHGEHRMLIQHSKTAQSMGIPASNMVIIDNGDVVELTENSMRVGGTVPSGIELVDSSRSGVVKANVLKERQQLAGDGVVTVAAALNWEGKLVAKPEVHLKGVVTSADREVVIKLITQTIETVLSDRWSEFVKPAASDSQVDVDWVGVQTQIEKAIQRVMRRELQSNPLLVFLMQIPEEASFVRSENAAVAPGSLEAPKLLSSPSSPSSPSLPSSPSSPSLPSPANQVTGRRRPRTAARAAS
jgi:ribonuclease J